MTELVIKIKDRKPKIVGTWKTSTDLKEGDMFVDCLGIQRLNKSRLQGLLAKHPNEVCPPECCPNNGKYRIVTENDKLTFHKGVATIEWAETEPGQPTVDDLEDGDVFEGVNGFFWHVVGDRHYCIEDGLGNKTTESLWIKSPGGIKRILGKIQSVELRDNND